MCLQSIILILSKNFGENEMLLTMNVEVQIISKNEILSCKVGVFENSIQKDIFPSVLLTK